MSATDQRAVSCFSAGSVAGVYDEIYVPRIFIPCAGVLLERAGLGRDEAVLDIASGPGTVARLAAEQVGPHGRVVAADFSEAMIAVARTKPQAAGAATVEYLVSPAAPLSVEDGAFDVITCQRGLQFFPRSSSGRPGDAPCSQAQLPGRHLAPLVRDGEVRTKMVSNIITARRAL
jgi:SAM-dependent methyltransferase